MNEETIYVIYGYAIKYVLKGENVEKIGNIINEMNNIGNNIDNVDIITRIDNIYDILRTNTDKKSNILSHTELSCKLIDEDMDIIYSIKTTTKNILIIEACKNVYNILTDFIENINNENITIDINKLIYTFDKKIDMIDDRELYFISIWSIDLKLLLYTSTTLHEENFIKLSEYYGHTGSYISSSKYIHRRLGKRLCITAIEDMLKKTKNVTKILCVVLNHITYSIISEEEVYKILLYALNARYIIESDALIYIIEEYNVFCIMLLFDYLILPQYTYIKICKLILNKFTEHDENRDMICKFLMKLIQDYKIGQDFELVDICTDYVLSMWKGSKYFWKLINLIIENNIIISYKPCELLLKHSNIRLTEQNREKLNIFYVNNGNGRLIFMEIKKYIENGCIQLNKHSILKLIQRGCSVELIDYLINVYNIQFTIEYIMEACIYGSSDVHTYLKNKYVDEN